MSDKMQAVFFGFCLGLLFLAFKLYVDTSTSIQAQNDFDDQERAKFRVWAENICAKGFKTAEFVEVDSYKVVCN